ncbi:MAG: MFS transporter [Oxalobacter sp.]|nr:MAG: MFS transporter [Oxalobacter sp.]
MTQRSWPEQAFNFGFFFFAYYGFVGVFSPFVSLYFSDLGMTAVQIGILMSVAQAMRIFGPNLWGWVADHSQQRSRVLRLTGLGAVLSFICVFFGKTFASLFFIMIALNLFTSAQGPLSEALMLAELKGDFTHYGMLRLWGSVGYIVVVLTSGWLFDWLGIGVMPWVGLTLLGLVFTVSMQLKETPQSYVHKAKISMRALIKQREIIAFLASACAMIGAHMAVYVFFSLYMSQLGYSKITIGLMWTLGVIAEIGFFFYQAPMFRRFGIQRLMLFSLAVGVVRFAMIGLGAEFLFLILLAQFLHGVTFGIHHSASVMTLQRWFSGPLQARGQALYISVSYGLGGTLGGIGFSYLWDHVGPEWMYLSAALVSFVGLCCAILSFRWHPVNHTAR